MAEREYIITIKNETGAPAKQTIAGEAGQTSGGAVANAKSGGGNGSTTQTALAKGLVAWRTVKPWINQAVSAELNIVSIREGSTELAQKRQYAYQLASQTISFGERVLTGAAVGGIGGAFVAAGIGIAHQLLSYYNNQRAIEARQAIEQQTLNMNYIRAGARGSRSKNE